MKNQVSRVSILVVLALLLAPLASATVAAQDTIPVATITVRSDLVLVQPPDESSGYTITISGPDNFYLQREYRAGERFVLRATGQPDGVYNYEIRFLPSAAPPSYDDAQRGLVSVAGTPVQAGSFAILEGRFITQDVTEEGAVERTETSNDVTGDNVINDQVILDDLIVDGSACIGFDCANGESFGFDTLRLKENNLRIHFQDTSTSGSFPSNDWRISINDSVNGGANYFAIQDVDAGQNVFVVEAHAGSNALYIDDYGRVGLGTSTPAVEMEVRDSDTPTVRLNQDNSGGWTPQTWDLAGNESNFFIRDVTNGSQLPFRIQPGADSNALTIKSDNKVGMGTWSPSAALHVYRNDGTSGLLIEEASGASASRSLLTLKNNGSSYIDIVDTGGDSWNLKFASGGLQTKFNSNQLFKIGSDGTFDIWKNNGATSNLSLDVNGNLVVPGTVNGSSSVYAKENFAAVNPRQVLDAVADLPITSWNFKFDDSSLRHLGPTAQDFYQAFGLGMDDEHIGVLDASGVALAAIQGLNEIVAEKDAQISALEARLAALEQARSQPSWLAVLPWLLSAALLAGLLGLLGLRLYSVRQSVK